jgi:hypothetical protein
MKMSEKVYWCMRDIGRLVGLTSHQIGKQLKRIGLRTSEGKPSQLAFSNDLVAQQFDGYGHYLWAWDRDEVLRLLAAAGVKVMDAPTSHSQK